MFFGGLLGLAVLFLALLVVDTLRLGAPPMPSSGPERAAVAALLERRAIELARPIHVLEAGAGWGGMALSVARAHPDFRITAVEASLAPAGVAWVRAALMHLLGGPRVHVRLGDARTAPMDGIDVVVAFLGPESTARLAKHLGALPAPPQVVSVGFAVRGWRQRARIRLHDAWRSEVGLWTVAPPD